MISSKPRNVLTPWIIGLIVIAAVDAYIAYLFYATNCQAPGIAQVLVVVVIPVVYLFLMYLTLKSQP
jgi:hypothetical protein